MTDTGMGAARKRARTITALNKPYRWQLPPGARDTLDFVGGFLAGETESGRIHDRAHRRYVAAVVEGALIGVLARGDVINRDWSRVHGLYADIFSLLFYGAARISREELVDHVLVLIGALADPAAPRATDAHWRWLRSGLRKSIPFIPRALLHAGEQFGSA